MSTLQRSKATTTTTTPQEQQQDNDETMSSNSSSNNKKTTQGIVFAICLAFLTVIYMSQEDQNVTRGAAVTLGEQDRLELLQDAAANHSAHASNNHSSHVYSSPGVLLKANKIRQISILGERNSGTRWTFDHISSCFNHSLFVDKRLTRYKHWFQYDNSSKYLHDTLVLAQFRNPYDWFKAMEHVPHHSPAHLRTQPNASVESQNAENDWQIFLTKEWTTERVGKDLQVPQGSNPLCQDDFHYKDVVSCALEPLPPSHYNYTLRYSEHQPFYEMRNDGSGLPYKNILELRTDKIRNFLSVAQYEGVADAWVVQYEYLLNKGTAHLLKRITEWTGVQPHCQPAPPQHRQPKKSRRISKEFAKHLRLHLNWTVEGWIGYSMDKTREQDPLDW